MDGWMRQDGFLFLCIMTPFWSRKWCIFGIVACEYILSAIHGRIAAGFQSFREEVSCCEVTFCAVTLLPLGLNAVENKALVGSIASVLPRGIWTAR